MGVCPLPPTAGRGKGGTREGVSADSTCVIHPSGMRRPLPTPKYDLQPSVLKRSQLPLSNRNWPKAVGRERRVLGTQGTRAVRSSHQETAAAVPPAHLPQAYLSGSLSAASQATQPTTRAWQPPGEPKSGTAIEEGAHQREGTSSKGQGSSKGLHWN